MSYGKILSHPVGDANFINDLAFKSSGSFPIYGTIYGKDAYKHPRITTDSLSAI